MSPKQRRAERETSAGGVVFRRGTDGAVRFLLIRDSYSNWGFPKGHLEPREPPAEAARREVAEETGLSDLSVHGPIQVIDWYFRFRGKTIHKYCHFFLFESKDGEPVPQVEEGITDCAWRSLDESRAMISYDNARGVLERAAEMVAALAAEREGEGEGGGGPLTAVVPVFHPRREARHAVRRGYPSAAGSVRLCRSLADVERLLAQRLVDAVVLDVKSAPEAGLALPRRFPRIPMHALSAFRPQDGALLAACHGAGFAGILVEGVDNAVAGEWVAARTARVALGAALAEAPQLLRLSDRLQLAAWEEVLRRVAAPITTGDVAAALRVTREHLSRQFAAGGAPNLKRVIDLARAACAANLLGNPAYSVRGVVRILGFVSPRHLAAAVRRVAGVPVRELADLGPRGVLTRFVRGRTRSRV